jgi:uncharacterized protein (TIGR00369 family)
VSEYAGQPTEESSGGHDAGERVRASFARQGLMRLLGAEVVEVGEGTCVIEVPFAEGITQQESYFHGVVTGAIADTADGYAAMTLAPPDREVLTVEYKVNFLAPAHGEKLVARGEVVTAACSSAGPRCPPSRGGTSTCVRPRCRRFRSRPRGLRTGSQEPEGHVAEIRCWALGRCLLPMSAKPRRRDACSSAPVSSVA